MVAVWYLVACFSLLVHVAASIQITYSPAPGLSLATLTVLLLTRAGLRDAHWLVLLLLAFEISKCFQDVWMAMSNPYPRCCRAWNCGALLTRRNVVKFWTLEVAYARLSRKLVLLRAVSERDSSLVAGGTRDGCWMGNDLALS